MEGWLRDLIIAVAGALIGAALLSVSSASFEWTARSRAASGQQRELDILDWQSGDPVKRQRIFNTYLFSVLKFFIIASMLTCLTTAMSDLEPNEPGLNNFDYIDAVIDGIAVIFYLATLVEIFRFTRLARQHP
jgi:hypothetical protein